MPGYSKFKLLVHYICSKRASQPDTLGAVKLNKILWLCDREYFYEHGEPITESRYIKREFGPVPARIMPTLRELEEDGALSVRDSSHFGKRKKEYVVHSISTGSFLDPQQHRLVDEIIDFVCDEHTAASVSLASHDRVWAEADDGEELPLFTVFVRPGKITSVEREWARMKLEAEDDSTPWLERHAQ